MTWFSREIGHHSAINWGILYFAYKPISIIHRIMSVFDAEIPEAPCMCADPAHPKSQIVDHKSHDIPINLHIFSW